MSATVTEGVLRAFDDFEKLAEEHAGDRPSLDAMVNAHLPEAREKYELAKKQAGFKAMSQIRGVAIEAALASHFLHPSGSGDMLDAHALWEISASDEYGLTPASCSACQLYQA